MRAKRKRITISRAPASGEVSVGTDGAVVRMGSIWSSTPEKKREKWRGATCTVVVAEIKGAERLSMREFINVSMDET